MNIAEVQVVRKLVLAFGIIVGVLLFAFTNSKFPAGGSTHEMIEWVGIVLMVTCILGRTWCTLYIGGRKIEQFVTVGPYSVSRNPLYFFSILGTGGVGAQLGSITIAIILGALTFVVFLVVAFQEERLLSERYGLAYAQYVETVPRFLPNPKLWRDAPTVVAMPPKLIRTFADAMLFLLSVPLAEGFEVLQHVGLIPVLAYLP